MKAGYAFFFVFIILLKSHSLFGQAGQWTWMNGDTMSNSQGHGGSQGVPGPLNTPPALERVNSWIDLEGNLWLYGGDGVSGHSGDLWKYDIPSNMWAWMNGPGAGGQTAVYGTKGIPAPNNNPGYRLFSFCTWTDLAGNFWLFGGKSMTGYTNDLWKYQPQINQWAWMKGANFPNDTGSYGQIGIPDSLNNPPPRMETSCTWVDDDGNLWLFGGMSATGAYNDLWKYDVLTNNWTWMKGSKLKNQAGTYGTKGIPAPSNSPGGRAVHAHWKDSKGNFLLFGGFSNATNYFNDLWKYNVATNNWVWMSGNNQSNAPGLCGGMCDTSATNIPCARANSNLCWVGECGDIYGYGGKTSPAGNGTYGVLGDMWNYSLNTQNWALIEGGLSQDQYAVYGTKLLASPLNSPGGKSGGCSWTDQQGNFWLFGGGTPTHNFDTVYPPQPKNTLWKYTTDTNCPYYPGLNNIVVTADTTICRGDSIQLSASGGMYYSWSPDSTLSNPDIPNPLAFPLNNVTYILTISNEGCSKRRYIHVHVASDSLMKIDKSDTAICIGEAIQLNAGGGNNYLWNTNEITPSINVQPEVQTSYAITITNALGCVKKDSINLAVNPLPVLQMLPSPQKVCKGDSILLTVSGAQTYEWAPATWMSGIYGAAVSANPLSNITYYVTATDAFGCQNKDSIRLIVAPLPIVTVSPLQSSICSGETVLLSASGALTYAWSPAQYLSANTGSTVISSPLHDIIYTVTGSNADDCHGTAQAAIQVYSLPLTLPDTLILCLGSVINLHALSIDNCEYVWQDGQKGQDYTVSKPGRYWVTASASNCRRIDTVHVLPCTDLWIPNAFRPSSDGENARFLVKASSELSEYHLRIYSRWGECIFQSDDINKAWDGNYQNVPCPLGVYTWTIIYEGIRYEGRKALKGTVTLLR